MADSFFRQAVAAIVGGAGAESGFRHTDFLAEDGVFCLKRPPVLPPAQRRDVYES